MTKFGFIYLSTFSTSADKFFIGVPSPSKVLKYFFAGSKNKLKHQYISASIGLSSSYGGAGLNISIDEIKNGNNKVQNANEYYSF